MEQHNGAAMALAARQICKNFGGVTALDNVSIEFPVGSSTVVMGDNGAGKSTLMQILSGVIQPDSGHLEAFGQPCRFTSPSSARAAGIETVYQNLALADQRDVAANLFLGREVVRRIGPFKFLAVRQMRQQAAEALRELRVSVASVKQPVGNLSGGQRQAIAIARAVHAGSRVIIMDEPTAALGLRESDRVKAVVAALGERGITRIIVSHNLEHAFEMADRIVVFRQGRIMATRSVTDTEPAEILHLINGIAEMT